jgi:hypothetical protein
MAASLDLLGWILRAMGVAYAVIGLSTLRRWWIIRVNRGTPKGFDAIRGWTVFAVGAITLHAGLSLVLLSGLAPWLFLLGSALQGAYLAWAQRTLPPRNEREALGRRRAANAFFLFLATTFLVLGARSVGVFQPPRVAVPASGQTPAPAPALTAGPTA